MYSTRSSATATFGDRGLVNSLERHLLEALVGRELAPASEFDHSENTFLLLEQKGFVASKVVGEELHYWITEDGRLFLDAT